MKSTWEKLMGLIKGKGRAESAVNLPAEERLIKKMAGQLQAEAHSFKQPPLHKLPDAEIEPGN